MGARSAQLLLRCLESGDFDDFAFIRAGVAESTEMAELSGRKVPEGTADSEGSGELQGERDVLEAEHRSEYHVGVVVVVDSK